MYIYGFKIQKNNLTTYQPSLLFSSRLVTIHIVILKKRKKKEKARMLISSVKVKYTLLLITQFQCILQAFKNGVEKINV